MTPPKATPDRKGEKPEAFDECSQLPDNYIDIIEKYTPKGNKFIELTRISTEEIKDLRISAYDYLL